ncbi:MAG TPA: hypothetical protein VK196_07735 [Magnetospirillum sp.]|nr:hypothetical protein [Magnetospirillum sp.]
MAQSKTLALVAAFMVADAGIALADEGFPYPALSLSAGTLGVGLDADFRLDDHFSVNLSGNYLYTPTGFINFGQRDAEITLATFGGGVRYRPLGDGFFLGAGVLRNMNRLKFSGMATEQGVTAEYDGRVTFSDFSPYLTIGLSTPEVRTGWQVGLVAGVLWQASPDVSIHSNHPLASQPQFQAFLEAQRAKVQDHANELEFYPMVMLQATYRF